MRTLLLTSAGAALLAGGAAEAQHAGRGASYPVPGRGGAIVRPMAGPTAVHPMPGPAPIMGHAGSNRWGSRVGGRWWGGANAPGGWAAYRRPVRGYALPSYWVAPRFFVNDWQAYGFRAPGQGYNWVRYYDDAVLVDSRGSVYDSVYGVDWDRAGDVYAERDDYVRDDGAYRERRDNGLGGAAIGAVVGGVAGNVVAGRGNRLAGTLIGAGVGGAAGYAIDRAEDRGRAPRPRGRDYPRGYDDRGDYPPPPPAYGYRGDGGAPWVSPDGRTTVVTSGGGWGGSTTTVTVQSAPIVTTTVTEEVIEDRVVYRRPVKRSKTVRRYVKGCRC